MNHRQKPPHSRLYTTYQQALEKLDIVLAKNTPSNEIEKMNIFRRILFGSENIEPAEEPQKMQEGPNVAADMRPL